MILKLSLAVLCCLGAAMSAAAETLPYQWRNVVVGAGGFAPGIVFSPAEKGIAFLRTDMGGAYRWDERQKSWIALQDGNAVSSYMGIESVAPDPVNPDIVYVAAGMGSWGEAAIMRSTDRGTTWSVAPVPFKMGGNEEGRGLGERLAVDPYRTSTLLFGSRHDGLQRSDDSGRTWHRVDSFPHKGLGAPPPRRSHAGISFVLFDPVKAGVVYAGVADPVNQHLYRSSDGGRSWQAVPGEPPAEMLPAKASFDDRGNLYIAYSTSIGPNDVLAGSVWRLETASGRWTDITPTEPPGSKGGYMGIAADRTRPGRLAVATMNRWQPTDTVWLTNDYGKSWTSLAERSHRDTRVSPFLNWGNEEAEFGHWIAGLAFDPFDGRTLSYTTGATVYRTNDADEPKLTWTPWVRGIEQTAVITMISPPAGPPLISGFGDLGGFVHEDLETSPAGMHLNPRLSNTNNLDYAGLAPNIMVRSGSLHAQQERDASLGWSSDFGRSWKPLRLPPMSVDGKAPARVDLNGDYPINVSADGKAFVASSPAVMISRDRGASWHEVRGLPSGARVIADKRDPRLFYAIDFGGSQLFVSKDGGTSFTRLAAKGLPDKLDRTGRSGREAQPALVATPEKRGELWLLSGRRLYRSVDAGASFAAVGPADFAIQLFGLGKAAPGARSPAIYAAAQSAGRLGVYRSIDGGRRWDRINDDEHQWGLRFRAVIGDPKLFGRVYVATDGRGILYGDPAR